MVGKLKAGDWSGHEARSATCSEHTKGMRDAEFAPNTEYTDKLSLQKPLASRSVRLLCLKYIVKAAALLWPATSICVLRFCFFLLGHPPSQTPAMSRPGGLQWVYL